jgi:hypothetical protein
MRNNDFFVWCAAALAMAFAPYAAAQYTLAQRDAEQPFTHLHGYGCEGVPEGGIAHADHEDELPRCREIVAVYHER